MGLLFLIVTGTAFGWLSAVVFKRESRYSLAVNLMVGTGGALLAGALIGPLVGGSDLIGGTYSVDMILLSGFGALTALGIAHVARLDQAE